MMSLRAFPATDRLLAAALVTLTAATLLLATDAHAFCRIFCIHGMPAVETDICAGRG